MWLGQEGEKKAAIPDALYKILIREEGDSVSTLAFILPNILPKSETDLNDFLTTIDRVEKLTGLDFLTTLAQVEQEKVETRELDQIDW